MTNLSKISALRSAASSQRSDATAKEGHVNYDVSDAPIEARAAPMSGSGCFGWVMVRAQRVAKNYSFLLSRTRSDGGSVNPLHTIEGKRRDARSLGRRMGVFGWLICLALSQEDATDGEGDGSVIIVAVFLVAVGQFSPRGSAELPAFAT